MRETTVENLRIALFALLTVLAVVLFAFLVARSAASTTANISREVVETRALICALLTPGVDTDPHIAQVFADHCIDIG